MKTEQITLNVWQPKLEELLKPHKKSVKTMRNSASGYKAVKPHTIRIPTSVPHPLTLRPMTSHHHMDVVKTTLGR